MTLQEAWANLQNAKMEYEDAAENEAQKIAAGTAAWEAYVAAKAAWEAAVAETNVAINIANEKHQALVAAQQLYNQALGHEVAPTIIPAPTGNIGPSRSPKKKPKLARK